MRQHLIGNNPTTMTVHDSYMAHLSRQGRAFHLSALERLNPAQKISWPQAVNDRLVGKVSRLSYFETRRKDLEHFVA